MLKPKWSLLLSGLIVGSIVLVLLIVGIVLCIRFRPTPKLGPLPTLGRGHPEIRFPRAGRRLPRVSRRSSSSSSDHYSHDSSNYYSRYTPAPSSYRSVLNGTRYTPESMSSSNSGRRGPVDHLLRGNRWHWTFDRIRNIQKYAMVLEYTQAIKFDGLC